MKSALAYLSDVRIVSGRPLNTAFLLVTLSALLEGIGLLSILPLFAVVVGDRNTPLGDQFLGFLGSVGLNTQTSQLAALSFGFLLLLALRSLISWTRDVRLQRLGLGYVDHWRTRLIRVISGADWPAIDQLRHGDMIHSITTDVSRLSVATTLLLRTLASSGLALIQILVVAVLSPQLFVFIIGLGFLGFLIAWPVTRRATRLGHALSRSGRASHRALHDILSAQKLARISNSEDRMADMYIDAIGQARQQFLDYTSLQSGSRGLFQLVGGAVALATLWVGYVVLDTPLATLAITLVVMIRVMGPIQAIASTAQNLAHALPAFDGLNELMAELEAGPKTPNTSDGDEPVSITVSSKPAAIRLSDVSFQRDGTNAFVFENLSFDIPARAFVALLGASGVGKTTLLDLIVGLYRATSGEVVIDGRTVSGDDAFRQWRDQIAYLPQDPFLFDGTIRENLTWAHAIELSDEALWDALDMAGARAFLAKRGQGLDLRVGERGDALSGGERQMICLARALLRQPCFLILDEATGSMDAAMERAFIERLSSLPNRPTILMVAHQTTALDYVDQIVRLSKNDGLSVETK